MTDVELQDLPEWAEKLIESGTPLIRLWTGDFVIGWPERFPKPGKPGPREMTVEEFLESCEVNSLSILRTVCFQARKHVSELGDHDEAIAFAVGTARIELNVETRTILLLVSGDARVDRCFADDGNPRC